MASDFLGRGWSFPPEFDRDTGAVRMVSGEADIRQSLRILFGTVRTERLMLPEYGSALSSLVFDNRDHTLALRLRHFVHDAILMYEPRIVVEPTDITVLADEETGGLVWVRFAYLVSQTNTRSNMVFPFYCDEGSNVRRLGEAP